MDVSPLKDCSQGALGELSLDHTSLNLDGNFVIAVFRVKVWRAWSR
ncbi:hypothetical protein QQ056_05575 [Oscillatoria laete-virens NRMC-F 0139]|nr:hypothetical protein [Oscillatoria laete-virens NRMC-F 0139]